MFNAFRQQFMVDGEPKGKIRSLGTYSLGHPNYKRLPFNRIQQFTWEAGRFEPAGYDDGECGHAGVFRVARPGRGDLFQIF
jgi:hypothetical protein